MSPGGATRGTFLLTFLPMVAIAMVAITVFHWTLYDKDLAGAQEADAAFLRMATGALTEEFRDSMSELDLLLNDPNLLRYLQHPGQETLEETTAAFLNFARHDDCYDQVRLLDVTGQELVRINHRDGRASAVGPADLQDKSSRYYFQKAVALPPGEAYVSPLDLNMERGRIEIPYRPMLRLAAPAFDASGERRGVVVLNYSGAVFGDRLDSLEGNAGEVHLVNEDGYWLHAPDPSLEWGFMFDDGSSFAASLPETWEQLRTTQAVEGISAAGRFAATTLRPMAHEDVADLRPGASRVRAPYTWKLITLQPEERLAGMLHAHLLRALLELGLATLLLGPLAWGYVESRERRRRALAELVASERRFASVTDSIPDAIVTVDRAEKVLTWNRAAAEIFGLGDSDVAGMPISWLVRNTEPRRATRLLDLPPGQQREMVGMRNDGKGFPLEVAVGNWTDESDEFISIVGRDITARREAEDTKQNLETELLHARKLEAVGQLAAGIAHEINTPTQFVGDNTRFLKDAFGDVEQLIAENRRLIEDLEAAGSAELAGRLRETMEEADVEFLEEEVPRAIDQSLEGLGRVGKIVSAMKEFAHPGSQGKTAADLNHCIESTVTVATNEWKYACDMELQLDPTLPSVVCSAGEINQVVLNMVVNAAHAVEEQLGERPTEKGLISISTETARDHVEIRIGDSGSGMPPEVRDRIFDPFFTTKAVGKGSGQGLAIAHDVVVRKHGGTIQVESEPGHGTTFIVRLPLQPNEQPDPTLEEATP